MARTTFLDSSARQDCLPAIKENVCTIARTRFVSTPILAAVSLGCNVAPARLSENSLTRSCATISISRVISVPAGGVDDEFAAMPFSARPVRLAEGARTHVSGAGLAPLFYMVRRSPRQLCVEEVKKRLHRVDDEHRLGLIEQVLVRMRDTRAVTNRV